MATYVYIAPSDTIYTGIPLTAGLTRGAGGTPTVWDWPTAPTDGRWKPTALSVNQEADNGGPGSQPDTSRLIAAGDALLSGHGSPPVKLGRDGEYWLDVDSSTLYGPRLNGNWPSSGIPLVSSLPLAGGTITGNLAVNGRLTGPVGPYGRIAPSRNTPGWRRPTISHQFQTGHGWTAQGTATSNLNNTAAFVRGTQCATITTDTAQGSANLRKYGMPAMDLTGKMIRLICRVDDVSKISSLNFFVGTSSLNNNFKWRLWEVAASSQLGSNNEWVTLTFGWSSVNAASGTYSISSTGVPSTTTGFTDFQVQAIGTAGNAYTLDVQAVEVVDGTAATFPNGVVSIVFDDGGDSIWNYARPAMDTYGFQGTNYVIIGNLGNSGVMTTAQNKNLQDFSGWEIGLHSYDGAMHTNRYTAYTAAQVDDDIRHGKEWLVSNGFRGEAIAYPGGEYQSTTDGVGIDAIAARYFSTGRTILFQTGYPTETFPAGMPMRVRAVSSISSTQTGANVPANLVAAGGLLDKCQLNAGWLVLVFHKIVNGTATVSTECSVTDFQTIMAGISARGIPVLPVSDVVRLHS